MPLQRLRLPRTGSRAPKDRTAEDRLVRVQPDGVLGRGVPEATIARLPT